MIKNFLEIIWNWIWSLFPEALHLNESVMNPADLAIAHDSYPIAPNAPKQSAEDASNASNEILPITQHPTISQWATLIARFEGANPVLNNPGDFKYSTLLGTWGGERSNEDGSDGGVFCKFPTYEIGFKVLCNFLTLGCEDELKDYHTARTIKEFTLVYTNHPQPEYDYSNNLIKELGVSPNTDISTFLSITT